MTTIEVPDYEAAFAEAIAQFWQVRNDQASRQVESGRLDAGTRGAVTGGKHLHPVADLIARVLTDAGMDYPRPAQLPGYYRRSKNWDIVGRYGEALGAVIELKSQVGSIGNNANNRIEEMIGQSVDFWKASREELLGATTPWFGYVMLIEDCVDSRRQAKTPRVAPDFPPDEIFSHTNYIERYAIALDRLRFERDMDQVCLVASTADGDTWYPDGSMTFQAFATSLHARGMTLRSQLGPI